MNQFHFDSDSAHRRKENISYKHIFIHSHRFEECSQYFEMLKSHYGWEINLIYTAMYLHFKVNKHTKWVPLFPHVRHGIM